MKHGDKYISDSNEIIKYLDRKFGRKVTIVITKYMDYNVAVRLKVGKDSSNVAV